MSERRSSYCVRVLVRRGGMGAKPPFKIIVNDKSRGEQGHIAKVCENAGHKRKFVWEMVGASPHPTLV